MTVPGARTSFRVLGPLLSAFSAAALIALLHRYSGWQMLRRDPLLFSLGLSFGTPEWLATASVLGASAWAVARRSHRALFEIQLAALALGLFLTEYRLGGEIGRKVDFRFALALIAGGVSLWCSYACVIAHAVLALLNRRPPAPAEGARGASSTAAS